MKGELQPIVVRTACEADLHMDGSVNELIYFLVWPLPGISMGLLCSCLIGCLTIYQVHTTRYDHHPCAELRFSPHKNDPTPPPAVVTAKEKKKNGTLVVLTHAVRGVFDRVVANPT